jgi:type I site-specific restriction-modification system R (restriction) subunit
MAVDTDKLKKEIEEALNKESKKTADQEDSIKQIAVAIAEAVATQIVEGINTTTVIPVLESSAGPVSGKITLKASALPIKPDTETASES